MLPLPFDHLIPYNRMFNFIFISSLEETIDGGSPPYDVKTNQEITRKPSVDVEKATRTYATLPQ